MRIQKASGLQVETLIHEKLECWQYSDCVMIEIEEVIVRLNRSEVNKLIKFMQKGKPKKRTK